MLRFIENLPLGMLIAFAVMLGLAPFSPEPHLVEKGRMLMEGKLKRPLDIFDLLFHGFPLLLLLLKSALQLTKKSSSDR